jgi:hypothetical protein
MCLHMYIMHNMHVYYVYVYYASLSCICMWNRTHLSRKKRPASRKQNWEQSHTHATKQSYTTQSEAKTKTPIPHTGRKAVRNVHACVYACMCIVYMHACYAYSRPSGMRIPLGRQPSGG